MEPLPLTAAAHGNSARILSGRASQSDLLVSLDELLSSQEPRHKLQKSKCLTPVHVLAPSKTPAHTHASQSEAVS